MFASFVRVVFAVQPCGMSGFAGGFARGGDLAAGVVAFSAGVVGAWGAGRGSGEGNHRGHAMTTLGSRVPNKAKCCAGGWCLTPERTETQVE